MKRFLRHSRLADGPFQLPADTQPLVPGGGPPRTDCIVEFSIQQVDYVAVRGGRGRPRLRCADGDPCDADGEVDDRCAFSVSVCLNNTDPNLALCAPSGVSGFEVKQKRSASDPERAALQAAVEGLGLPTAEAVCSEAVSLTVPVEVRRTKKPAGNKRIRTLGVTEGETETRSN